MGLKKEYKILEISKREAKDIMKQYHYLRDKDFLFMYAYGIVKINTNEILGAAVFGRVNGISSTKGWFGIGNGAEESRGIYELTRLAVDPLLNGTNATSFLLGNSLKLLKREKGARAVISLADTYLHIGYIYQACNFSYHGITNKKTDFFMESENEKRYKLNPIGKTKDKKGVWLPRSRKHRYVYIFDKDIKIKYKKEEYPKGDGGVNLECCNGSYAVFDKRFNEYYTCPRCTGTLNYLSNTSGTV
ncbi:Mom family adenine methylcarbamoylation protein [Priestia endophytica]